MLPRSGLFLQNGDGDTITLDGVLGDAVKEHSDTNNDGKLAHYPYANQSGNMIPYSGLLVNNGNNRTRTFKEHGIPSNFKFTSSNHIFKSYRFLNRTLSEKSTTKQTPQPIKSDGYCIADLKGMTHK